LPQRLQQIYQNIKIVGKFNPKKDSIQILVTHDDVLLLIKPINQVVKTWDWGPLEEWLCDEFTIEPCLLLHY
jgi:hypothetical protein